MTSASPSAAGHISSRGLWLLVVGVVLVPISLLWDFSWESTVGVDLFWSPPHTATHLAVALAAVGGVVMMRISRGDSLPPAGASRFGPVSAPLGVWLVAWGALAFLTAVLFDRWWQSAYGLQAGIWHPPQILKATAFLAMLGGAWLVAARAQNLPGGGQTLAAILFSGAAGCRAAMIYSSVVAGMLWLLPRFGARPLTGPIYNPMDHLMPPPFPLLLIVPALAMDWVAKGVRWPAWRGIGWLQAGALGVVFFMTFAGAQWLFAEYLLSPAADNWFIAGGGKHWPFFLKISPRARVMFWNSPSDLMNWSNILVAAAFSVGSARLGLWLGAWMSRLRR